MRTALGKKENSLWNVFIMGERPHAEYVNLANEESAKIALQKYKMVSHV